MNRIIRILYFLAVFPFVLSLPSHSEAQQSLTGCYVIKSGEVQQTAKREGCEMNKKETERYQERFLKPTQEIKMLLDKASQAIIDGNDDLAISLWTQALSKSSKIPEALLRRGSALIVRGQYRQGYEDLKQLERLLRLEGFPERADVIAKMIKDTQAEYLESGVDLNN